MQWICTLIILAGCFPLFAVLFRRSSLKKLIANGCKTTATVTTVEFRARYTKLTIGYPVDKSGEIISQVFYVVEHSFKKGDQLDLYFDIQQPYRTDFYLQRSSTVLVIMAIVSLAVSIFLCLVLCNGLTQGIL